MYVTPRSESEVVETLLGCRCVTPTWWTEVYALTRNTRVRNGGTYFPKQKSGKEHHVEDRETNVAPKIRNGASCGEKELRSRGQDQMQETNSRQFFLTLKHPQHASK